jgi:hypothetical protein
MYLEFSQSTFKGAELNATDTRGFTCAVDVDGNQCYGAAGKQVLKSLQNNYQIITTSNTAGIDCAILLAMGSFFTICYVVLLQVKLTSSAKAVKLSTQ